MADFFNTERMYAIAQFIRTLMRGGGYNLMGGSCSGSKYPAAQRNPLSGNNHHPNVTFRIALYLK